MPGATPPFHAGEVALAYNPVAMTATGGVQPYTWSVGAGALPDGLSLGSGGQVTGTPTRAGQFPFTVVVADSAGSKASLNASVSIVAALTASFAGACGSGKCSVEQGCVSVCGGFGNRAGGAAPYSYKSSGPLPNGTKLSGLALTGTFSKTGTYNFTVTVTDSFGATASLSPTFTVFQHISFGGTAICGAFYKTGCQAHLPYALGEPNTTPSVKTLTVNLTFCAYNSVGAWICTATATPPAGFTATASGGSVTFAVPGSSAPYHTYSGTMTFQLVDQALCGSSRCTSATATLTVDLNGG